MRLDIFRKNIRDLKPYSSAREDFSGNAAVYLDANENPIGSVSGGCFNRYPDPLQSKLRLAISRMNKVDVSKVFIGNGSDEIIDLIIRATCEPGKDNLITIQPSYGMYKVYADINDVECKPVMLKEDFSIEAESVINAVDVNTKLIFICSPNNPTGKVVPESIIKKLLAEFDGIVVVDEAYIDFSPENSMLKLINQCTNLLVMQTFSKAWGMSALRLGVGYANEMIIEILDKIKPPYNVNMFSQNMGIQAIEKMNQKYELVSEINKEKEKLERLLKTIQSVEEIFESDSNFILVRFTDADAVYQYLLDCGIVVRNRSKEPLCNDCLRITVGTSQENDELIKALITYESNSEDQYSANLERPGFAEVKRYTTETQIEAEVDLNGTGKTQIDTGLKLFDHMLEQLGKHGGIDLTITTKGDLEVDEHHTIEDTAIVLGEALAKALGDKRGIERYGFVLPMDDCLATVAIDLGGRPWLVWNAEFKREKIGDMPTEMFMHFFKSFSDAAKCNLNIRAEGENEHHTIEDTVKGLARALKMAVRKDVISYELPSTKGII